MKETFKCPRVNHWGHFFKPACTVAGRLNSRDALCRILACLSRSYIIINIKEVPKMSKHLFPEDFLGINNYTRYLVQAGPVKCSR